MSVVIFLRPKLYWVHQEAAGAAVSTTLLVVMVVLAVAVEDLKDQTLMPPAAVDLVQVAEAVIANAPLAVEVAAVAQVQEDQADVSVEAQALQFLNSGKLLRND